MPHVTRLNPLAEEPFGISEKLAGVATALNKSISDLEGRWIAYDADADALAEADPVSITDAQIKTAAAMPGRQLTLLRDEYALRLQIDGEYFAHLKSDRIARARDLEKIRDTAATEISKNLKGIGFEANDYLASMIVPSHPRVYAACVRAKEAGDHAKGQFDDTAKLNRETIAKIAAEIAIVVKRVIGAS